MVPPVARSIIRMSSKQRLLAAANSAVSHSTGASYSTNTTSKNSQSRKDAFSQGHVSDPANLHKRDMQGQSVKGGQQARNTGENGGPMDSATDESVKSQTNKSTKGNPEGIGMRDQVGSASGTQEKFERK